MRKNTLKLAMLMPVCIAALVLSCERSSSRKSNANDLDNLYMMSQLGSYEIISPERTDASLPRTAINDSAAIIVWAQNFGDLKSIFKSERRNGVWAHPAELYNHISPDGSRADKPCVAIDSAGNAVVAWEQESGSVTRIFKSEFRNGAWAHPANLTEYISPGSTAAANPVVAMDDQGNTVVVWQQSDGAHTRIYKSEYRGNAWTHPASVSDAISPDTTAAVSPAIAMNSGGDAIITWVQNDGFMARVYKSEYRGGAWTHPAGIFDAISPDDTDAALATPGIDDAGNTVIAWRQSDLYFDRIYMSEYRNGTWTHPAGIGDAINPGGTDADNPRLSMSGSGEVLVTWDQNDGSLTQVFISEYRGGVWHHPLNLSDNITPDNSLSGAPVVAVGDGGNGIIIWQDINYTGFFHEAYPVLRKSLYRGGAWHNSFNAVNPPAPKDDFGTPGWVSDYSVRATGSTALMVWVEGDGVCNRIHMSEENL